MPKNIKTKCIFAIIAAILCTILTVSPTAYAAPGQQRLSGEDRYETAVAISKSGWQQSNTAILATGEDFPDALCAAPLAKRHDAPILLTNKDSLDTRVSAELKRLGVKELIIIGGIGVLSDNVKAQAEDLGINCTRIFGADRYQTSLEIAKELGAYKDIVIATGENFPDALSIAPVAAVKGMPIILSDKDHLPDSVKEFLKDRNVSKAYVIGGPGVLSDSVLSELSGKNPERLSGNDRYETNIVILNKFIDGFNLGKTFIATGNDFPDALAGSALAPKTVSPIILTDKKPAAVTQDFIRSRLASISNIYILGGEGALPRTVLTSLLSGSSNNTAYYNILKEGSYEYEGTITVKNNSSVSITDVVLEIDIGRLNDSMYQSGETVEVKGAGSSITTDAAGNKKAIVKLSALEKGQSQEYKIVRRFKNGGIKYTPDISKAPGDYSGVEGYSVYTSPEDKVESDNTEIKNKAAEITKGEKNPYNKAKKIFEFVNTAIEYDFSEANKGALNALTTRKGVCEDFADLFAAMLRSTGVPTRVVTGYWIDTMNSNTPEDASQYGHAWAEFYLPEYGWIVAEPTVIKTDFLGKRTPAWDFFANLNDPGHFVRGYHNQTSYSMKYMSDSRTEPDIQVTTKESIRKLP